MTHLRLAAFLVLLMPASAVAAEPVWENRTVLLTRPGVKLETLEGEKIEPKTAGVARDVMFQVAKVKDDRIQITSRRQIGWIEKKDAVLFEKAVEFFDDVLKANPKDTHALIARGVTYVSKGQADKALADLNTAIGLDPKATLAIYNRANHLYGKGQYDEALKDYNTVIEQDPGFDWAYHVRGWIFYRRKDYEKALADYETAIRLVPTETVFYRDRGNISFMKKDWDNALADYTKSIQLDPTYTVPLLQRAKTWEAMKEYAKAVVDYTKAAEIGARHPYASMYFTPLAMLLASCPDDKVRDGKKSLEAATKAHNLTKGPGEMAALAAAHAELGVFEKAVEWQTKAIEATGAVEKAAYRERLKLYEAKKPYRME